MKEPPEQFEIEKEKYSIIGKYPVRDLLHLLIDEKFPVTSAYLVITEESDRPPVPVFHNTVVNNMDSLFSYYRHHNTVVAVYERMPVIKHPERVCGNCKEFCTHYSASDNSLGLLILNEGHCKGRHRVFSRKRDDPPKDEKCFEWNAKCAALMAHLNGPTE